MGLRIAEAVPPYTDDVQKKLARIMPSGVAPLALFRVLARSPRLFSRFFAGSLLGPGALTLRERELVILRTCARNRSEYEWGVHVTFFAPEAGLDDAVLTATVHGSAEDPCFSPRERLFVRLADELAGGTEVSDALAREAQAQLDDETVLEVILLTGFYRTVSTLTNALALPLEWYGARFPAAPIG